MLLSCLNPFVVSMLRSQRDLLSLAVIFTSLLAVSERSIDIWVGPGESWIHWIMGCGASGPCQEDESGLQVLSVLLYGCETWTLTGELRQQLNSFGTRSLRRILGYHWSDFVFNERLLKEIQMRFVCCIVREHQLRMYGHVARFPDADPAHQILSARESR